MQITNDLLLKQLHDGDIIFQTSRSSQSMAIQMATKSKYSHMGIVYVVDGEGYVYEAVQPVKMTRIKEWIDRGENAHYIVKRLKDSDKVLTEGNLNKLRKSGEKFIGKDYDLYFGWSDDKIYCSELVWKMYNEALGIEIGQLQQLREFDLTEASVQQKLKERYGNKVPLTEAVISPARMFDSDKLITVTGN